jgi:hypothetical protein
LSEDEARRGLALRLGIKPGDTVNRFKCRYLAMGPNADELETLCQEHNRSPSPYSFEFGPHRPCHRATLEDKLPLTITQFLWDRVHESQRKAENSVLAEDHTKIAKVLELVLQWQNSWPILIEGPQDFEANLEDHPDTMDRVVYRVTQQLEWLTAQAYIQRFGKEPPTSPLVKALAALWSDHPEYQQEWSVG